MGRAIASLGGPNEADRRAASKGSHSAQKCSEERAEELDTDPGILRTDQT